MAGPKIGNMAPAFTLSNQDDEKVSLKDFKGKSNVIVYFYPRASTPGCTLQACGLTDIKSELEKRGYIALGVSFDPVAKIKKYEDITDRMEVEIADYLAKVSQGELSESASIKVRSMISMINDMERIGDICYQMSISVERKNEQKAQFMPEPTISLEEMIAEVTRALQVMNNNLNTNYSQVVLTEANEIEIVINKLRNKLRKNYLKRIEKGEVKIQTAMIYNNLIHSLEKIGDHIFNISEASFLEEIPLIDFSLAGYISNNRRKSTLDSTFLKSSKSCCVLVNL